MQMRTITCVFQIKLTTVITRTKNKNKINSRLFQSEKVRYKDLRRGSLKNGIETAFNPNAVKNKLCEHIFTQRSESFFLSPEIYI